MALLARHRVAFTEGGRGGGTDGLCLAQLAIAHQQPCQLGDALYVSMSHVILGEMKLVRWHWRLFELVAREFEGVQAVGRHLQLLHGCLLLGGVPHLHVVLLNGRMLSRP